MFEKPVSRCDIADHINEALKSSEIEAICRAIGDATRLYNMSDIAKKSGVGRSSIYRSFAGKQLPNLLTVVRVLDAMGLELKIAPRNGPSARLRPPTPNSPQVEQ